MRPIKFRGRDLTGEMRFGHYVTDGGHPYIIEDHAWREVEPESVAQLVGYDCDDNEVYDDDTLIDQKGREYTVSIDVQVELFCGGVYEPLYSTRYKFRLKEGTP